MASRLQVVEFLCQIKTAITEETGLYLVPRKSTNKALVENGLTRRDVVETILQLTEADFCSGPERDRDQPGEIWVFGKQIEGVEFYVKLKHRKIDQGSIAKCLSFHPSCWSLTYPLRG